MLELISPVAVAFLICMCVGPLAIPALQKLKFGQVVRSEGPKSHLSKTGTPTMGGMIILLAVVVSALICIPHWDPTMTAGLICICGFGVIGLLDDGIKVIFKRNLGLKAWQKSALQLVMSVVIALYVVQHVGTSILIPFTKLEVDLGWWYFPILLFILVGTVNAVNLTDGLDSLAAGTSLVYFASFSLILYAVNQAGNENLILLSGAVAGACLGFLRFNVFPARVFMGDTGSLALGGAVAYVAIASKMTLWLPIMGGVFVASVLSDIIQVVSYKTRHKRVFKMAPLHHHFELMGMPETRVVAMYMIATVALCMIGMLAVR